MPYAHTPTRENKALHGNQCRGCHGQTIQKNGQHIREYDQQLRNMVNIYENMVNHRHTHGKHRQKHVNIVKTLVNKHQQQLYT
jgi:hypothetical protein